MSAALRSRDPQRLAILAVQAFLVPVLALTLFLALVVPYHATDALVFGGFSRWLGLHGGFLHDVIGYPPYSRPLFYAPQGWLWWLFGAHEWIGRLLSLAFFLALLWGVFSVARDRTLPATAPWLAVLLLFACPDFVLQAIAGQTDVPVAAMIALLALLLWRAPPGARTAILIVLVAAAAVLAKATALPALVGLGAGMLLGDRAGLLDRLRWSIVPLAIGTGLGLLYGVLMARHFNLALNEFLGGVAGPANADPSVGTAGGSTGSVAGDAPRTSAAERVGSAVSSFTDSERPAILLRVEWLGSYVRMLALFSLVYAAARVVAIPHRIATIGALALGLIGYWIGPEVLAGGRGALDVGAGALVGSILLLVLLAGVLWCPPGERGGRLLFARLLAWGLPPLIAWGLFGILGDTRTLSPAWPALFVLIGGVAAMGLAGLASRWRWAAVGAIVVMLGLALLNLRNYDGLGARPDGTINSFRALKELTPGTWFDPAEARIAADPQLGGLVVGIRAAREGRGGRVLTNDGRLGFYFLRDATVTQPPASCADLEGYDVLAVLLNLPVPFDPTGFDCLEPVRVVPGSYAVYAVR